MFNENFFAADNRRHGLAFEFPAKEGIARFASRPGLTH
jgi:hypothetical protein